MQLLRRHFAAMGGDNEITIVAADEVSGKQAIDAAVQEVQRIEAKYSRYRPDSVVSQINQAAGSVGAVLCDEETTWLFNFADTLFRQSDGLFDITSGILRRAWTFSQPVLPSDEVLKQLLALIGWDKVERIGNSFRLPLVGMEIDFGGFGKEYASDRAAAILAQKKISNGYVNLGGDICAIGPQANGKPWLIGIQNPRKNGETVATIPVSRGALATSGDYEKYFDLDGKRYCHILNPVTGYPVHHWRSVSVLAPLAIAAGSYSTIAMLKEESGLDLLQKTDLPYLLVDQQGKIHSH